MNGIIYCATFTNGRVYVGQTIQTLNARKAQHKWYAENFKDNFIFHRAIRKYGFDNIKWEVLEDNIQDLNILNSREQFWIKEKQSYNKENKKGCNMTPGGDDRGNLFKYTENEALQMVERYKQCGNSSIIGKEFGTNGSVVMRYIKRLLPDYQQYSYNGKGKKSLFNLEEKQEIYNYYKTVGSSKLTMEKFNIKPQTFYRIMKGIDENYFIYEWNYKIPKLELPEVIEEFKNVGRLEPIAERYHIHTSTVREIFKHNNFADYVNYIKRKSTRQKRK